jgi:hypothetical protein
VYLSSGLLIGALACAIETRREPDSLPGPPIEPAGEAETETSPAVPERDPALARLEQLAVHHDDFARAELYTWTTAEQLRRLRDTKQLLVADPSTGGRASPFNQALMAIERDGSPLARLAAALLERPELRRRRYAWPSPFATTMGLGPRRYGDSLVRIELDPRAWIGRFEPGASEPLSFVDMHGQAVAIEAALAEPERVAAYYHLRGPPEVPIAYREYVVCSEAMIRSWSIATPQVRARVEAEIELLEELRAGALAALPRPAVLEPAAPDWVTTPRSPTPLASWHASLAFDNQRYRPSPAKLAAIADTLRGYEDDGGPPLVHHPAANADTRGADL